MLGNRGLGADHVGEVAVRITTQEPVGERVYVGHVVCRTAHTVDLLITEPYDQAGRTVVLDTECITAEEIAA